MFVSSDHHCNFIPSDEQPASWCPHQAISCLRPADFSLSGQQAMPWQHGADCLTQKLREAQPAELSRSMLTLRSSVLQRRVCVCAGLEGCWWSAPGAAEGITPQAKAYRLARFQDLQLHWLMPYVAAQLAAVEDDDAQATAKTQSTGKFVLCSTTSTGVCTWFDCCLVWPPAENTNQQEHK